MGIRDDSVTTPSDGESHGSVWEIDRDRQTDRQTDIWLLTVCAGNSVEALQNDDDNSAGEGDRHQGGSDM